MGDAIRVEWMESLKNVPNGSWDDRCPEESKCPYNQLFDSDEETCPSNYKIIRVGQPCWIGFNRLGHRECNYFNGFSTCKSKRFACCGNSWKEGIYLNLKREGVCR